MTLSAPEAVSAAGDSTIQSEAVDQDLVVIRQFVQPRLQSWSRSPIIKPQIQISATMRTTKIPSKRLESLVLLTNIVDLVVQCAATVTCVFAMRACESALFDGIHALGDDGLHTRLELTLHSTTWRWIHVVPYLFLLMVIIHKCLFVLLTHRQPSRFEMAAFVFDSICVLMPVAWLTYWLATSSLVQLATFLQERGQHVPLHCLQEWILSLASMTVSMAVCIGLDFLYLARAHDTKMELQDELNIPLITEPVV